jgi:uncharacterized protein (DUF736 family)
MQNFVILKSHKDNINDKTPDYRMKVKEGEEFVEIGGCWLKENKNGNKFFSCRLSLPYGNRKGWKLESMEPETPLEVKPEARPEVKSDFPENTVDGIPF